MRLIGAGVATGVALSAMILGAPQAQLAQPRKRQRCTGRLRFRAINGCRYLARS